MVITEVVFGEGDAQRFNVDLERMLLKYDYNDHLKISLGRYHTGIGYYNFNSGTWLQTTADRPLIMEFADDGGLLPTQAVGLSITGSLPSGRLGLNYLAEYGSGDTMRPSLKGTTVNDENNGSQINIGLFHAQVPFRVFRLAGQSITTKSPTQRTEYNLGWDRPLSTRTSCMAATESSS